MNAQLAQSKVIATAMTPRASERKRNAAKGGKVKANRELSAAKDATREVIDGVLSGRIERSVGAVTFQGYNTLANLIRTEMKVKEVEELTVRLEELVVLLESRKDGDSWAS